ncbi:MULTISPECIES: DUF1700 domain-containing protein [unclassified Butyrivibrio]|uniref:DUF1700 domain-containing protein n=1 Tax=unclassified Butyrivibrio TaxID=2639466 RepID=UPI0003B4D136|nr:MULTISPECIES: DUF1700 domain-containing protein [unclassified Butyrivibrio]SDB33835.1 Uncharacterized membrane protein [Butyrivibrio sp. INlla16]
MNKEQFLNELDNRLRLIPVDDRLDAIEYYDGYISDMELTGDEDVVAKLGTPKEVAKSIIEQCTQKHIENTEEQKTVKGKATVLWLTILGIISLPLSLPLGIAAVAVVFALGIALLAILLSLVITAVAIAAAGFASIFWGVMVPGIGQKFFTIGAGLIMAGLGIALTYALIIFVKAFFRSIFRNKKVRETRYE